MRKILLLIMVLSVSSYAQVKPHKPHSVKPANGLVPNAATAIKIAVAIWEPIYGAKQIAQEKPYKARLNNGVWIVEGSLPRGSPGGVAIAEIDKRDGRTLRVSHGK